MYDDQKQSYTAAGYVYPLNKCYKIRNRNSTLAAWEYEQCIDTYDQVADTLTMKCYSGNAGCNGKWHTPKWNETKKCGTCKDGWLVVCPHGIRPIEKVEVVPAGKYVWAVSSLSVNPSWYHVYSYSYFIEYA